MWLLSIRLETLQRKKQDTLDFIAHGFCAGLAEMDMNLVGCLADFLYHRWRVFRRSGRSNGVCRLHSTGFSVHGAPFSGRVYIVRQKITHAYDSQGLSPPVWWLRRFPPGSSSRQRESGRTVPKYGHRYEREPDQAGFSARTVSSLL